MTRVPVPVACTLEADAAGDRVGEWRTFLATRVLEVRRDDPAVARLRLAADRADETLLVAADLAQREKACCAFFRFSVDLEVDSRWLRVEVPADAVGVLDDFFGGHPSEKEAVGRL